MADPNWVAMQGVDKLVAEKVRLQKKVGRYVDRDKIWTRFINTPAKEFDTRYERMVERIASETKTIGAIEDTVRKDNLISGLAEGVYPVPVEFGQEARMNSASISEGKTLGEYHNIEHKIKIAEDAPDKFGLWIHMTHTGIPEIVRTLDHEIIHYWSQTFREKKTTGKDIFKMFSDAFEAKLYNEVAQLAFIAAKKAHKLSEFSLRFVSITGFFMDKYRKYMAKEEKKWQAQEEQKMLGEIVSQKAGQHHRTKPLLRILAEFYGFKKPEETDEIIIASQTIDRLKALALTDQQVAYLFANAKFDRASLSFPEIQKIINGEVKRQEMTLEDLDTKVDIKHLEDQVENLKAAVIAGEELDKFQPKIGF